MKRYLDEIKELNDVVKELLDETLENGTIEQIESRRRDGFIPSSHNHGGYLKREIVYLSSLYSSGQRFSSDKANQNIESSIDYNHKLAKDEFKSKYSQKLEGIEEDKLNYNDLYELEKGDLAERLSEIELEMMSEDTIMLEIRVMYHGQNEEGVHSITVDSVINWESPYHRSGKNNEDLLEEEIEFKDVEELKTKLKSSLSKMTEFLEY